MVTCLQVHNDYLIPGGETKSVELIAKTLEDNGIRVVRYYKSNHDLKNGIFSQVRAGICSFYNKNTIYEIEDILQKNKIDFALIHNISPIISNSIYTVLKKHGIKIIKYLQNYNLLCLNGALDQGKDCLQCKKNHLVGVKNKCYKSSKLFSFQKFICLRELERKYINNIDAFIAISQFVKEKHISYGILEDKIHVIYHFCEDIIPISGTQKSYFLFMGRLSKEKGIYTLIETFKNKPNRDLYIMGTGPLEEEISSLIMADNIKNIKMLGFKQGEEKNIIIKEAKALIVPSEWDEPFGRIVIEAYQFGTPVIVSNRGGLPELVTKESGCNFRTANSKDLSKKIEYICSLNDEEYLEMRKNAKNMVYKEFSKNAYIRKINELLDIIGVQK